MTITFETLEASKLKPFVTRTHLNISSVKFFTLSLQVSLTLAWAKCVVSISFKVTLEHLYLLSLHEDLHSQSHGPGSDPSTGKVFRDVKRDCTQHNP